MPAPLRVPLVFRASRDERHDDGLILPKDWRSKRFMYDDDYRAGPSSGPGFHAAEAAQTSRQRRDKSADDASDTESDEGDEEWPEIGLQQWTTTMTVWSASELISVRDENGESSGKMLRRATTQLGSQRSRRRLAVGTQDGTIKIFQEEPDTDDEATELAAQANGIPAIHATDSKTSIASPSSQTSSRGRKTSRTDFETLSSPTTAVVSTTDAIASPTSPKHAGHGDAEDMLEEQWHAGEASSSVMSGMMHSLGIHDGQDHKGHSTLHSTPSSRSRLSSAPMSPTSSRRSHASSLTGRSRPLSVLMGTSSSKTAALQSDGSGKRASSIAGQSTPTSEALDADKIDNDAPVRPYDKSSLRPLGNLKSLTTLQCTAPIPISGIEVVREANQPDTLLILQRNGTLTLCRLDERTSVTQLSLPASTVLPASDLPMDVVSNITAPSPLMKLAALRSQAGSPAPGSTRSRAQSNAGNPDAYINLPGTSFFTSLQMARHTNGQKSTIALCFDENKKKAYAFNCRRSGLVAVKYLPDIGDTVPRSKLSADGSELSIFYLNKMGALLLLKVALPINSTDKSKHAKDSEKNTKSPAANEDKPTYLSSASTLLRREGLSRSVSNAPSIAGSAGQMNGVIDLGEVGIEKDARGLVLAPGALFVTWGRKGISVARRVGDSTVALQHLVKRGILNVQVEGSTLLAISEGSYETYQIDNDGNLVVLKHQVQGAEEDIESTCLPHDTLSPITCVRDGEGALSIRSEDRRLWEGTSRDHEEVSITASYPFSMEKIALALSTGQLLLTTLSSLVGGDLSTCKESKRTFLGSVKLLQLAQNTKTQAKFLLGGTEEGDVVVWDANTLDLLAHYSLLTSPIVAFITFGQDDNVLRLHSCTICVSANGAVFVLALDGLKDLYVIPGRGAPLTLIAARANELMLAYADDRARVWDMASLELRRSIGVDQSEALLEDGRGWWSRHEMSPVKPRTEKITSGVLSAVSNSRGTEAGAVTADIRRAVEAASRMVAAGTELARIQHSGTSADGLVADSKDGVLDLPTSDETILDMTISQAKRAAQTLRPLLRALLPSTLPQKLKAAAQVVLGIEESDHAASVKSGLFLEAGMAMSSGERPFSASKEQTAMRLLVTIAMLDVLAKIRDFQTACNELIPALAEMSFTTDSEMQVPSLLVLADFLLDPSLEIRNAAQTLFVATLRAVPQEQLEMLCTQHGNQLPSRSDSTSGDAAQALLLLGLVATQRYTEMSPILLKDVAISIVQFLADEQHMQRQAIAIVLCSRGFTIFQNYFDAMEVVRSLFALSSISREGGATSNISGVGSSTTNPTPAALSGPSAEAIERRDLARAATLRIAEDNTPLFMTTLSHDILHARSPAHCSATMRLVALMVRRKPHILYPNLPRLAEAVVKSLDPTMTAMRNVVHRSATIIISELITTYPTIAFHKDTQRLAVGTFEGAIIMYDLKTATRLYVLEAHTASLNGLAFSSDGHRLVSLCLRDGMVKVWKTGTGFRSIFAFGSAPRQVASFLSGSRAADPAEAANGKGQAPDQSGGNTSHASQRPGATMPYKSFDFGHLAGAALASAAASPSATSSAGTSTYLHTTLGHASSPEALMHDLRLVRFEWLGERSVKIRVSEASMVFDVA